MQGASEGMCQCTCAPGGPLVETLPAYLPTPLPASAGRSTLALPLQHLHPPVLPYATRPPAHPASARFTLPYPSLPTCLVVTLILQFTFYEPVRSTFEYSSRLACPGTMGPPLCLTELQREAGGNGTPRLVWGDTGGWGGSMKCLGGQAGVQAWLGGCRRAAIHSSYCT